MAQSYLSDILHVVAQWLLVPDIILLLLFIGYALFCIGSVIAELFSERKHFKVVMPQFLRGLMEASEATIPAVIEESGLLKRQKEALMTVYENRDLPGDALLSLVKREVGEEESRYDAITGRNGIAARVAPMLGLMGTLIPLGPGIEALGRADTAALSSSLLVAFDTTVAGLVVAAVCLVVGKIRSSWYNDYMSALDSAMATMLEKIEAMRGKKDAAEASAPTPANVSDTVPEPINEAVKEPEEKKLEAAPVAAPAAELKEAAEPVAAPAPATEPESEPAPAPEIALESEPTPAPKVMSAPEPASAPEVAPAPEPAPVTEVAPAPEPAPASEVNSASEPAAPSSEKATDEDKEPQPRTSKKAADLLGYLFEAEPHEVTPADTETGK